MALSPRMLSAQGGDRKDRELWEAQGDAAPLLLRDLGLEKLWGHLAA